MGSSTSPEEHMYSRLGGSTRSNTDKDTSSSYEYSNTVIPRGYEYATPKTAGDGVYATAQGQPTVYKPGNNEPSSASGAEYSAPEEAAVDRPLYEQATPSFNDAIDSVEYVAAVDRPLSVDRPLYEQATPSFNDAIDSVEYVAPANVGRRRISQGETAT